MEKRAADCLETPDDYAGEYNNHERDLELMWEWSNMQGPSNCWATENAKIAGWIRLLLIDLEIAKGKANDSDSSRRR